MSATFGVLTLLVASGGALQEGRPRLEASVDEDRVSVGEELTYTLRAVSRSPVPMAVTLAPVLGLEILERSERTEVGFDGGPTRTTVLAMRLRAVRPGQWQVGPARAVQGGDTVDADALIIDVAASRAVTASMLSPRLRELLLRAAAPPAGQPAVDLLVSTDTVRVGGQVDVVTAAWFPRDLRLQLRRPPTLQPPVIDGVWSYPQTTPNGIAATRNFRGRWYDLFVAHQIVFPLVPGTVRIPRATLKYSTPVALQFFSQEERFALSSRADTLVVRQVPDAGRPASFGGAIGSALKLERRVDPPSARVGEGLAVELRLSGDGNTALWPTPAARWPPGARAYLERVDERVRTSEGRAGGTKSFRYLVVPDSAGPLALPAVNYAYFDLATGRYASLAVAPASIPVTAQGEVAATAVMPPELLRGGRPAFAWSAAHAVPDWVWLVLLIVPPLSMALRTCLPIRAPRHTRQTSGASDPLGTAEAALDALILSLAPEPDRRSGPALAAAVRGAGADPALAERLTTIRERLLARRYGPGSEPADDARLAGEVQDVVRRLGGARRDRQGRGAVLVLALALGASGSIGAQQPAPEPERLYESGALQAAADAFARRAAEAPAVAGHWYNLGATYYRLGRLGRAEAAWLRSRRLAPRESAVVRALALTPLPDVGSVRWTWSPPVTPEELLLVGGAGWLAGWLGWVRRPRARDRWFVLLVLAGASIAGGLALRAWYRRPLAIVLDRTPLRLSPHGRAPVVGPVESGGAVRVLRRGQGWLLVHTAGGEQGWVPDAAVAAVGG